MELKKTILDYERAIAIAEEYIKIKCDFENHPNWVIDEVVFNTKRDKLVGFIWLQTSPGNSQFVKNYHCPLKKFEAFYKKRLRRNNYGKV